jgi:hypothetical protein
MVEIGDTLNTGIAVDNTKESVKLIRNSKGYTWESKIVPELGNLLTDADMERLKKRNEWLAENYGDKLE